MKNRREQTNPEDALLRELGFGDDELDTGRAALQRFRAANERLWKQQEMSPEYLALLKERGYDEEFEILEEEPDEGGPEG
ncbi:MAG: hypothetical protein LUD78_10510 [Clostridiales bacterium]|nr:hypothetical protein [Clostridiales bacterium]